MPIQWIEQQEGEWYLGRPRGMITKTSGGAWEVTVNGMPLGIAGTLTEAMQKADQYVEDMGLS